MKSRLKRFVICKSQSDSRSKKMPGSTGRRLVMEVQIELDGKVQRLCIKYLKKGIGSRTEGNTTNFVVGRH